MVAKKGLNFCPKVEVAYTRVDGASSAVFSAKETPPRVNTIASARNIARILDVFMFSSKRLFYITA